MRNRILHISSITLLLIFLAFSSGIKLVQHTCAQCGIREFAFFSSTESCCATTAAAPSCCAASEAPTCSTDTCCEHEAQYLALEDSYVPSTCKFLLQDAPQGHSGQFTLATPFSGPDQLISAATLTASPPVPLTGKSLLIAVQQLKIACIC